MDPVDPVQIAASIETLTEDLRLAIGNNPTGLADVARHLDQAMRSLTGTFNGIVDATRDRGPNWAEATDWAVTAADKVIAVIPAVEALKDELVNVEDSHR